MVAYSFQPRFVTAILAGAKDQTIRSPRASPGHPEAGAGVQLYTGMRTKACRLVIRTVAMELLEVELRWRPIIEFAVDGERIATRDMHAFAVRDGFGDVQDMARFWDERHGEAVFRGFIVRWRPPAAPVELGSTVALPVGEWRRAHKGRRPLKIPDRAGAR